MTQQPLPQSRFGSMPPSAPAIGAVAIGLIFFYVFSGTQGFMVTAMTGAMEIAAAALVVIAAGGLAWPVVSRLAPTSMPRPFVAVSAAALGLWGLSILMLILGSLGWLNTWLCWSVLLAGLLAAGYAARDRLNHRDLSPRVDARALVWVVCGLAVGMWLAGAMRPPGMTGMGGDHYDVLEYHLQVPREFFNAGAIKQLTHNVYSHYPLGTEMLSLMAMHLRGGAYEGMYLAKCLHGVFGALAVLGLIFALRDNDDLRGRLGGTLLATYAPLVYLSWLAFAELSMICYLTLGLLWLRAWIHEARWQTAAGVGAMLGAACAFKYLSVGFIAGPVLVVMALATLTNPRRIGQLLLALAMTAAMFSPWLIRNTALTGNPVFPLATDLFGQGYWTDMQAERWQAGHAPGMHAPVPEVPGWQGNPPASPGGAFWSTFASSGLFNPLISLVAIISFAALLSIRNVFRKHPWDVALIAVLVMQLVVWTFTRGMPWRFVTPAIVPLILLATWGLARLAEVKYNPLKKNAAEKGTPPGWGRVACIATLLALLVSNVVTCLSVNHAATARFGPWPPLRGQDVAERMSGYIELLPEGHRVALIGDAQAFYFPADTIYATTFDPHPLAMPNASAEELRARARELGVTHLLVNWRELWRLGATYGINPAFTEGLYQRWQGDLPPTLPLLDELRARTVPILLRKDNTLTPAPGTVYNPAASIPQSEQWNPNRPPQGWPIIALYAIAPEDAPEDWRPDPIVLDLSGKPDEAATDAPSSQPATSQPARPAE